MPKKPVDDYLQFCSRDRQSGTSSDFSIILPEPINDVNTVRLEYGHFPTSWYNTGTITVTETGGSFVVTLPNQYLNPITFTTWFQNYLNTNSPTPYVYSVTWDSSQSKYTISATGVFSITWNSATVKDFLYMLGFGDYLPNNGTISGASTYTSPGLSVFLYPSIRLYVRQMPTNLSAAQQYTGQWILPVEQVFPGYNIITRTSFGFAEFLPISRAGGTRLGNFSCQFQDIQGNPLNMNGCDSDFVFNIEHLVPE